MSDFSAKIKIRDNPADRFTVCRLEGTETATKPLTCTLDLVTSDADFAFEQVVGKVCRLEMASADVTEARQGIVTELEFIGEALPEDSYNAQILFHYRLLMEATATQSRKGPKGRVRCEFRNG